MRPRRAAANIALVEGSLIKTASLAIGLLAAVAASVAVSPDLNGAGGAVLAATCLAIAVFDYRSMIIPDELNAFAFLAGLAAAALGFSPTDEVPAALVRAGAMFASFFVFRLAYRRLRGVDGLGLGDVKLAAVAGAWLDWPQLPLAVDIAALSALTVAVLARLRGVQLGWSAKLPFGVFFAPAIWLCWLLSTWRDGAFLTSPA